ncbi:hypothetical protein ACFL6O_03480 [candidate division KSB1 bacterium]
MRLVTAAVIVFSLILLNCGSTAPGTKRTNYDRNLIVEEEILKTGAVSAYDLINKLRPFWLRGRGSRSVNFTETADFPIIYVNGQKFGTIETLREISNSNITEIRFLPSSDATIRFGMNHGGGAIMIKIHYEPSS